MDIIYKLWRNARLRMYRNLALIRPDLSQEDILRCSYQAACMVGANGAFMLGAEAETTDHVRSRVRVGPGFIQMAQLSKRGVRVVVTLGHTVPFDGILGITDILGIRAALVVERLPWLVWPIFSRTRTSWEGISLVPIKRGRTYEEIQRCLCDGQIAVVLLDIFRPPGRGDGVDVRIGNATVGLSTMPVALARCNNAFIYTLRSSWDPDSRIIFLDAEPFDIIYTDDENHDICLTTKRLGLWMGKQIQKQPECWMRLIWQELTPTVLK